MQGKTPAVFRIFVPVTDIDRAKAFYETLFDTQGRELHQGRIIYRPGEYL